MSLPEHLKCHELNYFQIIIFIYIVFILYILYFYMLDTVDLGYIFFLIHSSFINSNLNNSNTSVDQKASKLNV